MNTLIRVLGVGGLVAVASSASATVVDLTTAPSFGILNGARYETSDFRSAGTGVINPFVRIQAIGTERGYNTSGRPVAFDEHTDPNFTHDLRLGDVPIRNIDGTNYYEFILDINQAAGGTNNLLSLHALQIYTSATGSQTTSTVSSLGALRYDMDAGDATNRVEMDYNLNSGSGQGDMNLYVPASLFSADGASTFVYLYSEFGVPNGSNDGFEEWAIRTAGGPAIPLPTASLMGLAGLLGLATIRRR